MKCYHSDNTFISFLKQCKQFQPGQTTHNGIIKLSQISPGGRLLKNESRKTLGMFNLSCNWWNWFTFQPAVFCIWRADPLSLHIYGSYHTAQRHPEILQWQTELLKIIFKLKMVTNTEWLNDQQQGVLFATKNSLESIAWVLNQL